MAEYMAHVFVRVERTYRIPIERPEGTDERELEAIARDLLWDGDWTIERENEEIAEVLIYQPGELDE